jgi:hypothetical protein
MNKNTEKYLKTLIKESYSFDVEEMALRQKGMRKDEKPKKFEPVWREDNPTPAGEHGVPDAWILNPTLEPGKEKLIVPLDCEELNNFIEKNKEWLDSLGVLHNLEPELVACKRTKDQPRSYKTGTPYYGSGEKMSAQETIKRKLFSVIDGQIANQEFSEVLNKRSIPTIVARDRKHVNMYTRFDNDRIVYETHNYNAYETVQDFLKAAIARVKGGDTPEMKTYHLARQYNQNYSNWAADKKNQKQYAGKTDIYKLDAYGLEEKNLDVSIRMDFKISGEKIGESFTWNVRMVNKIGKKLSDESGLRGGFLDDKLFQATTTAQLDPTKQFTESYTVMDDINVVNALLQAIEDLKSQIESVDPKETLKVATVKQYQIKRNVNEDVTEKLIKRIVNKLNK